MFCSKHPKYQALRKPRCRCIECWAMWDGRNALDRDALADALVLMKLVANDDHYPVDLGPLQQQRWVSDWLRDRTIQALRKD